MEVMLDGRLMVSREAVHDLLAQKLELPDYYGRNLDALFDVLSEYPVRVHIKLSCMTAMQDLLGNYAKALIKTLTDAASAFPNVEFSVSDEIF